MMKTYFYRIVTASFVIAIGLSSTTASGQINFKGLKKKVEKEVKSAPKKKKKSSSSSSSAGSTQQTGTPPPSGTTSSSSQGSADGKSETAQQSSAYESEPMLLSTPLAELPPIMQVDRLEKLGALERLGKGKLHDKINPKRLVPMMEELVKKEQGSDHKVLKVFIPEFFDEIDARSEYRDYDRFEAYVAVKSPEGKCNFYFTDFHAFKKNNYNWTIGKTLHWSGGIKNCKLFDDENGDENADVKQSETYKSDPNYYYSSHKASWWDEIPLGKGFIIKPRGEPSNETSYLIEWPEKDNLYSQGITYDEKMSKFYGKPAFYGNPFKISFNGDPFWKNWGYGDDNMKRCLQPEAGVFLFYGDDQLGRSRKVRGGSVPYLPDYTSDTKAEEYPVLVLARTEAKLKEWTPQRAKDEVAAFEDKIRKQVMSESRASLAAVRMPNKGGMHTAANFSRAEGLVKALCERDGTDYKNLVLTSDKWKVVYKPNGVKDYRIFMGYFADHAPSNEYCIIHTVSFRENATSNGEYSGKWYIPGVGQDPNVGPETPCENVEKK